MASRLGFTNPLSSTLFILFPVIFAIFTLTEYTWLIYGTSPHPSPGEVLAFTPKWVGLAKLAHLWCVLPAGTLLPLQFVPAFRRKYKATHRWSGRLLFVLLIAGTIAGMGISYVSFGGTIETLIYMFTLGVMVFYSTWRAWRAAWKRDYRTHRIWSIRTWGWAGSILTMRPMMFVTAGLIVSPYTRTFYSVGTCKWVQDIYGIKGTSTEGLGEKYPTCFGGLNGTSLLGNGDALVAIRTGFSSLEERAVTMNMTFGTAGLFAIIVHIFVVEWWLNSNRDGGAGVKAKRDGLRDEEVMKMKTRKEL